MNIPNNVTLSVLIWHSYFPDPYCNGLMHGDSPSVKKAYVFLNTQAMIQNIGEKSQNQWILTEKGQVYVDHLRSIPLPTEKSVWQIPSAAQS